jgi:predicted dienelactone hydrolase
MTRIGVAGHSLGGYTALGLAGAWPSWKDPRIKAVLALSPFCSPYVQRGALGQMDVPVMYQGGTVDLGITPTVKRLGGAYQRSSAPRYFVELQGAGHLAWTNLNPNFQDLINRYSVAFFDRYVGLQPGPDALTGLTVKPLPKHVSDVRVDVR